MWKRKKEKEGRSSKENWTHYNLRVGRSILILTQYPEAQKKGLISLIRKQKTDNKFYHDQKCHRIERKCKTKA